MKDCCAQKPKKSSGWLSGLLAGILPHTFCLGFLLFSLLGATLATTFFRRMLLIPSFFPILVALSFIFATVSAIVYFQKTVGFTQTGIKKKWLFLAPVTRFWWLRSWRK